MSWESNWQQDLTPVDRYTSGNHFQRTDPYSTSSVQAFTNLTQDYCVKIYENVTRKLLKTHPGEFCNVTFDGLLCWPPTPVNQTAVNNCFSELFNVKYDATQNVTKRCLENGSWSRVNYLQACRELIPTETHIYYYYFAGYVLSLVTLSLAITILTHFKELRCLRNQIHLNFMWAHLSNHVMWIVTYVLLLYGNEDTPILCFFDAVLLQYSYITTFFWMLVEGLYLYVLVVKTLTYENLSFRFYVGIGWGLPLFITVIWAIGLPLFITVIWAIGRCIVHSLEETPIVCQWFDTESTDLIFQIPVGIVVFLNFVFLISIMCVLITKLRSAPRVETQQYYKAAKALLVLNPLLGTTYVFTFYSPTLPDNYAAYIFDCVRAILLSTQGFVVALCYCFRNAEVQNTISHHFHNWRESKSLGHNQIRNSTRSKDLTRTWSDLTVKYFDVNNQYGWSMSQHLPYGDFDWAGTNTYVTILPNDSPEGGTVEVDLEYAAYLYNSPEDLPFCPQR